MSGVFLLRKEVAKEKLRILHDRRVLEKLDELNANQIISPRNYRSRRSFAAAIVNLEEKWEELQTRADRWWSKIESMELCESTSRRLQLLADFPSCSIEVIHRKFVGTDLALRFE